MKNTKFFFTTIFTLFFITFSYAQTNDFDSGSTGADGDLVFDVANGANQVFDHLADGHEGVWNFNFIVIPAGVTVTFPTPRANSTPPVIWLASGDVDISGIISINGESGKNGSQADTPGEEPKAGAGGFAGGLFGADGYGPGGGEGGVVTTQVSLTAPSGNFAGIYGNRFLQPLVGGSGGGGVYYTRANRRVSGGGGGGAMLISSSTSITVNGTIRCNGGGTASEFVDHGQGFDPTFISGRGSGGGIRLIADKISGSGTLSASPNGRIAIEAFDVSEMALSTNPFTYYLNVQPTTTFSLSTGTIHVVDVDGNGVAFPVLGRTQNPDVFFANAGQITVSLECENIPLGTQLVVVVKSTNGGAPTVSAQSTPLAGTLELSTATAQLTVPAGRGVIHAYASYQ